jgi:hypothetical protein
MIRPNRMGWAEYLSRIGNIRNACRTVVKNPEGKIPLGRSRIILNFILNTCHRSVRAGFFNLSLGTIGAVFSTKVINFWIPFKVENFMGS